MKETLLKKMREDIAKLKHELNKELPKEIEKARELGDLSENAEYQAAKERQLFVRARLEQLTEQYSRLNILDFSRIPKDKIGLGSTAVILDLDTDEEKTYTLVIAEDADAALGKISVGSPIGRALLGKVDGDELEVVVPGGTKEFEVLSFKTIYDDIKINKEA